MHAAIVTAFDRAPEYGNIDAPVPRDGQTVVHVRAAALSQLVRAQASGKHYSGTKPPFVPGADGVGRLDSGERVYFAFPPPPIGAMAEHVVVSSASVIRLPDDIDDVTAAALANPAMSSWASLTARTTLTHGESVLINGATGASGRLAIQIAKHLGAGRVIATSRRPDAEAELRALGADAFIATDVPHDALVDRFRADIATGIDIVLDYVWGRPAEAFFAATVGHTGGAAARRIRYINVGGMAGPTVTLPAAALRSSGLELLGSGLGSLSNTALLGAIRAMFQAATTARLRVDTKAVPLKDVAAAWTDQTTARVVFEI